MKPSSTYKAVPDTDPDFCPVTGEQALWRAVITQALMDAGTESSKHEARVYQRQAIAWLSRKNKDLQAVAALAGYDIDYVMERAKEAISNRCKWRSAQGRLPKKRRRRIKHA